MLFFVLRDYVVTVINCIEVTLISWKGLGDYEHKNGKGALFGINHDLLKIPLGNRDFFPAEPQPTPRSNSAKKALSSNSYSVTFTL